MHEQSQILSLKAFNSLAEKLSHIADILISENGAKQICRYEDRSGHLTIKLKFSDGIMLITAPNL